MTGCKQCDYDNPTYTERYCWRCPICNRGYPIGLLPLWVALGEVMAVKERCISFQKRFKKVDTNKDTATN